MKFFLKTIAFLFFIILNQSSYAGLIWFSRANCVNNESITWDWPNNSYWLWTDSDHRDLSSWKQKNFIRTGWEYTFRSGAVDWGGGVYGKTYVLGAHYQWLPSIGTIILGRTSATGCNLNFFFPYWR